LAQDPYQELGVSRGATADEIRKAFRKLAKQLHPDQNPDDKAAEERFKRVSAAFDILGDVEKRKKFDRGEIDADGRDTGGFRPTGGGGGGGFGGGPFGRGGPAGGQGEFEGVDLNDLFEMFGRNANARGSGGFGGFGGPQKGSDVRAEVQIDIEEAVRGGRKRIAFSDGRTVDITIPKGAEEGQVLRLKGQGAPGRAGAGDALIELKIAPHPVFRRDGANLVMDLPISVPDAVLGAKVEAPTPDGSVKVTVAPASNSGATLRLKGKGLPAGGRRGDLLVRLVVTLPDKIDEDLRRFAEAWRSERPYTPRRKG